MRYTDKKKKKPSKTSQKRERDREQAEADAVWNEFYAQLIEYGMLHDSYQVPRDYTVDTDEGRSLPLGQWLHMQGQKLNEYSRTNPQWYSDILDLIETGKLWFDNDAKRSSPTDFSSTTKAASPKASSSSSQPPATLDTFIPSIPKAQSSKAKDHAMASTSDEDSDNSMMQHARYGRTPSPSIPSVPMVPDVPAVPKSSRSSSRSPTAAATATQKKAKALAPICKKSAASPEVGEKRKGSAAAPLQLPQRAAKTRASAKAAYKDPSDSELSEVWQNDFEDDFSDGEGSLAEEAADQDEMEEDGEEVEVVRPAPHKSSRGKSSRNNTPQPVATKPVPVFAEDQKGIRTSHSAFASAVLSSKVEKLEKVRREEEAARAVTQAWKQKPQKTPEPSNNKSSQPVSIQTAFKNKPAAGEFEKTKAYSALASTTTQPTSSTTGASASSAIGQRKAQPVPPTIPIVQPKSSVLSTLPEPSPMPPSATGLMRPEQCKSTAPGGVMPPRRTLSRPKPVLAPVPSPPPLPQLSPRTPVVPKDASSTAPPPPIKTAPTVPTVPSGSLPHAAVIERAEQAPPSTAELTFQQKVRQLRLEKEAAAAGHGSSSPRSDVSIAGSDLPPNSLTAVSKTVPAFPAPRGTYTGVDLTKRRSSISEAKQAAVRAAEAISTRDSSITPMEDDDKLSPRSTGTASNSSGSSPPPMVFMEALETPDEAHPPKNHQNNQQKDRSGEETETEEDGEEEEEEMKIIGGRRGKHRARAATPHRLDDFGSQQTPPPDHSPNTPQGGAPVTESSVGGPGGGESTPEASGGPMEVIDTNDITTATSAAPDTTTTTTTTTTTATARDRAYSVMTINSDTTAGDDNGRNEVNNGNGYGTDVGSSDDDEDEEEEDHFETDRVKQATRGSQATSNQTTAPAEPEPVDTNKPQYYLQMSESESEDGDDTGSVEELPPQQGADATNAEFVAFAYTRSSTGPQCPMLGIGMVCNADDDDSGGSMYLIVMVPEDAKCPLTSEYRMDPDEFIAVQRSLVLARDLTFADGKYRQSSLSLL